MTSILKNKNLKSLSRLLSFVSLTCAFLASAVATPAQAGLFSFLKKKNKVVESKFYGAKAQEAKLQFTATIEMDRDYFIFDDRGEISFERFLQNSRDKKVAKEKIDEQLAHIIGYFQSASFVEKNGGKSSMGDTYKINFKSLKVSEANARSLVIQYDFSGKAVFDRTTFFAESKDRNFFLKLPLNPDTIFAQTLVRGVGQCSDEHYNSEGDFFYFWDPDQEGCPLRGSHPAVLELKARATALPNTDRTYPEYQKIFSGESVQEAFIFIGYLDDEIPLDRVSYRDPSFLIFRSLEQWLQEIGAVRDLNLESFSGDVAALLQNKVRPTSKGNNLFRRYKMKVKSPLNGKEVLFNVNVLLGDTAAGSEDETFRKLYSHSLENGRFIIYDGHSGLGGNLDLSIMPDFDFKKMDYQIMFFNGCSSYPYFKTPYLKAKGGSVGLDIVTSGLTTYDTTAFANMRAFLFPFLTGKIQSYQNLLNYIEQSNGGVETYLTAINGDEDNTFRP